MKFTDIFIRKPVLALVVNILLLVVGAVSFFSLNVRQYPKTEKSVITVITPYFGANAELVRGFITTPLERVIASVDGIDYLDSSSAQGLSTIKANLRLNYDSTAALAQIAAKVDQVRSELPVEAEAPSINIETADSQIASMYLSFYSEDLNQSQITDYLLRVIQPRLSAIAGVQKADILGSRTFAMRIWLKPEKLSAYGISPQEVSDALARNNYLSAVGQTKGAWSIVNLVANTDLKTEQEFKRLVVKNVGDRLIRLEDLAEVSLGSESYDQEVRFSGQQATFIGIWVLPNANALDVISEVRRVLPELEAQLPQGLKLSVPYDATNYIRDALNEIVSTLIETLAIVALVIFCFMGSIRSVLIPLVAMPLSLICAGAVMALFGFSINLLTILAVVLAVGLVVDDAIVVVENIERRIAEGLSAFEAAILGARELTGPIVAMTVTLIAVYAPIGFQGGLTGSLFKEFAFTLAGAVAVSGIVALTLSPMMSSAFLKDKHSPNWFSSKVEANLASLNTWYQNKLEIALGIRGAVISFALLFTALLIPFLMLSMRELAPREDQGFLLGVVESSPNASIDKTTKLAERVHEAFASFPEFRMSFQLTNPTGGFSGMSVVPWSQRDRTIFEIEQEALGKLALVPGLSVFAFTPPPLPSGGDFPVEFVISSTRSPKEIFEFVQTLQDKAQKSGIFTFVTTDLRFDLPQTEIVIDRDKASALGLDLRSLGADLSSALGGGYVNRINIDGRAYRVIPQMTRTQRLNPEQVLDYRVASSKEGEVIPLSTVATLKDSVEPRQLNRFQQLNSAKIQAGIIPIFSIEQALTFLEKEAKAILPQGYFIDYAGESRQFRQEGNSLVLTFVLAIVIIFLVLAAQFNSFRDPFVILLGSVPLALSGALVFVFLGATSINIYSQVGLITLVGLVSKNGILIVEFANQLQEQGLSKMQAVMQASATRLRPILMTSAATIFGHFPLVLVSGAGAAARNSIGIVLVSGMLIGTIFTLFVVPVIYSIIAKDHAKNPSL
jgi:multidrug efflux pump